MDLKHNIKCPSCSRAVMVYVREMVPGASKRCPHCRAGVIRFAGDDGRRAQRSLNDLERSLKNLGGTIKIRL